MSIKFPIFSLYFHCFREEIIFKKDIKRERHEKQERKMERAKCGGAARPDRERRSGDKKWGEKGKSFCFVIVYLTLHLHLKMTQ